MPREIGHLALPHPAIDQAPGRQEHERALGVGRAEYLVEETHAVDRIGGVALGMWIQRAHGVSLPVSWGCSQPGEPRVAQGAQELSVLP